VLSQSRALGRPSGDVEVAVADPGASIGLPAAGKAGVSEGTGGGRPPETLTIARATEYERVLADLVSTCLWVPVPDDAWETVRLAGTRLAQRSCHQGLSVADHLVVATALHRRLTILHEDADFATAAQVVPELQEHRISTPID
jgi:predicted nucleic acid-binding protein